MLLNRPHHIINVIDLDIDSAQQRGTVIDVDGGTPFYTFAYFRCPIFLLDRNGFQDWSAGTSILYAPENARYVRADSSDMLSSWFTFSGFGASPCIERYGIQTNTVLNLGEPHFLRPILEEIHDEKIQKLLHWEDAISDLVRGFFRQFSVQISEAEDAVSSMRQKNSTRLLKDIRTEVHSNLTRRWTIEDMAALGNVHPVWFGAAYRKLFGRAPIDDLLDARLKHAEDLLRHVPTTIKQVAADCGFPSAEHFARLFKKRTGYTPGSVKK